MAITSYLLGCQLLTLTSTNEAQNAQAPYEATMAGYLWMGGDGPQPAPVVPLDVSFHVCQRYTAGSDHQLVEDMDQARLQAVDFNLTGLLQGNARHQAREVPLTHPTFTDNIFLRQLEPLHPTQPHGVQHPFAPATSSPCNMTALVSAQPSRTAGFMNRHCDMLAANNQPRQTQAVESAELQASACDKQSATQHMR